MIQYSYASKRELPFGVWEIGYLHQKANHYMVVWPNFGLDAFTKSKTLSCPGYTSRLHTRNRLERSCKTRRV